MNEWDEMNEALGKIDLDIEDAIDADTRGDDELDAAVRKAALAMQNQSLPDYNDPDYVVLRDYEALARAAIDASGLTTALATAKGERDQAEKERDEARAFMEWTPERLDNVQRRGELRAENEQLRAALSTAKGERDAAVAALRDAAEYGCADAERHGQDWTTCLDRWDASEGMWCSCCIARNFGATLEAPHA